MALEDKKYVESIKLMFFMFILLVFNTFVRTRFDILQNIGEISTNLTLILMFWFLIKGYINRLKYDVSLKGIYITLTLLMLIYTLGFFRSDYVDTFYFLKVIFLFLFILGAVRIKWNTTQIKLIGYVLGVTTLVLFVHWILSGYPTSAFKSIFRNQNYLAVLLFSMLYFTIITIKKSGKLERLFFLGISLINLILIVTTSSRSVLIGIVIVILAWVILKHFRDKFSYLIYIIMFGNLFFVAAYVGIKNTGIGSFLDHISLSIFGKSLFSGRSEIWAEVIHAVFNKPLFGYGVGVNASDVSSLNFTSHNLYLQLFLEVGLIGFLIFFLFIFIIWKILNYRLDNFVSKWSACFMLGILVYESFELTLFQNNYSISMLQWLIITIGINFTAIDPIKQKEME